MAAPDPLTGASLPKPSLPSSSSLPLLLSTHRPPPPPPVLRSHSPSFPRSWCFTPAGCSLNRSDSSSPPKFRGPPGFDEKSWFVVMDKPAGEGATEEQMVDCYIQTLAQVLQSEDKAMEKIYRVLREEGKLGFGCVIDDDETVRKLRGLPGVVRVDPDPFLPEYNDPADTLKHFSLNLIRFLRHEDIRIRKDEVKDGGSAPKWYNDVSEMVMERVEENIYGLSNSYKALDSGKFHSKMQSRVEKVLSELSMHVKQFCSINTTTEEAGKDKDEGMAMEQVKKVMESLSLAQEAVDLYHSCKGHIISLMAETLNQLSKQVMELEDLTTQEAGHNHEEYSKAKEEAPDEDSNIYGISFTDEETGVPVFVGLGPDAREFVDSEDKLERLLLNMKKFTKYRENYKKEDSGGDNPICSLALETWFMDPKDFEVWLEKHFT